MIFDGMTLPDSTLPLDNILPSQPMTDLQNMMSTQGGRMMPQSSATLQDMMARQNAAMTQNRTAAGNMPTTQNARTMPNMTAAQNGMTSSNMMQPNMTSSNMMQPNMTSSNMMQPNMMPATGSVSAVAAMQSNRSSTNGKAQAAQQLAQSCFAVHEAVLYLDTHPDDQNALEYYRRKQQQLMQASENYQKVVGPLRACTVDTSSGSWRWVETPWPWEIEEA